MEYGRLSGKLYSREDWLDLPGMARELLVTVWSWAIDHDKEDGLISSGALLALAGSLGFDSQDRPARGSGGAIDDLVAWGWLDDVGDDGYRINEWEQQAELMRAARQRREKERERYLRRKGGGA